MTAPRFHPLTVADIRHETPDAVSVAFRIPDHLKADYRFAPGQYLTLRAIIDGAEQRRAYSICSTPEDGELRIAAREIAEGSMSRRINRDVAAGDIIEVMTPTGRFGAIPPATGPRNVAAFAAGSGITPVIAIIRAILAREPESSVFLAYGNRSADSILFRDALSALKDRYTGRFSVVHILSREEQDIPILNGRLDRAKAARLLGHMAGTPVDHVFICGPEGMIAEVEVAALDHGIASEAIHVERFVSALGGAPRAAPKRAETAMPGMQVTIISDGKRRSIDVAHGEAVLDAALRAGLDLPYACKGGMCCTCRARVVAGAAAMAVNYSLEPWESAAGFVLTCQARPISDGTVIDFDQV
ncbi:2Fe-2S iron-sulfur cluster binding domain-containing protein [Acidiphilium sp. AL]|uniref:2Fe-2S iron-sulfur cluster-binding protein n=1 Tax=Acidiphilium iwatense TaxID=768198 RepID=A0ABS9DZR7_9PROT|nr:MULTISPECIES: 2Fe-2S iron-sulfur cluster-binding protein [Acidiphilium]MCF3947645.1 2Fe-2S iron-sulfur cluster-binding protein [Acidiphilium iwatense]MCU4160896.1 2Fe-2S iron-sulfur cluster binding domain-containing protein [Acidiphilium sp. AL]